MLNCMIAVVLLPQFTGELQLSSNLLNQFTIILDFSELDKFIEFDFRPNKLENLTQFCLRYQVKIPGMQFTFRILPYIQDACEIQFTVQKMKKLNTSLIVYDQNDLKIQQIDIQFSVLSTLSSEFALSMFLGFSFIVIIFVCRFFSRRQEERTVALILLRMLEFQRRVPQLEVKIRQQVIQDEPVFHYKEFYLINPPSLNIQQSQLQFEKQSFMYKENKYDLFILNVNAQNVFEIMEISCEIKTLVGYCVISEQTKRSSGVRYVTIDQLDNFLLDDDKCSKYYLLLLFQYQSDISFDELLQNSIQLIQQFDLQTFMMDDFYAQQHLISKSKNLDKLLQKLESELNQQEEVIDMQPIKTLNVNLENNAATPVDLWELVQKDLRQQKIQNLDNQSIIPEFYYKQAQNDIASVYSDQYNSCGNDIVSVQSFVSDTFNSYREIIHHVNYPLTTFTTQPQFESQLNSQVYNIIEPQFTVPDITPKITNFEESSLQINTKNQQQNICDPPIVPYLNTTNNDVCDYEDTPELTSAVIHNISEDLSGNDYQQQLVSYYNQFLENIQSNENITESSQYTNYFPPLNTEAVSENVSICEIPISVQNPGNDMFTAPTNIMTQNPGNDMFTAPTNIMTQNPGNDMFTAPTNIMTQNPGNDMFTAPTNIMTQNPGNDMFTAPTNIMTQNPSNDMFTAPTNIMTQNPETEVYSTLKDQNQPFSRISFTNFESGLISPQDIQLNSEAGKLDVFTDSSSQSSNIIQPNNINKKIVIQKSFSAKSSLQLTQGYRYIDDDFSTLQDQGKITDVSQLNPKAFFNIIIQKLNKNKLQDIQEESQGLLNLLEYPSLPQVDSQQDRTYNLFSTPKNALDPIMQLQYSSLVNLFDQLPQNLASIMIIGGPIFRLKLACIAVLKYKSSAYYLDFRAICTANISFLVDEEKIKYKLNVVENIYQSLIPYQKAAVYTQSQMSYQRQKIISACIGIASYVYLRDISDKVLTLQCLMDICINNPDDNISSIIIQLASQNTWELFLYAVKHILINY
uniref:Uncharacterized protein n=1 Tax=Spironucleus salmonicida TaxID=348837 RepID=V6LC30_9EUKA|eukprot:EST41788.1 hypothetical protein SS50377_18621 [Spironucleus salmonicida]